MEGSRQEVVFQLGGLGEGLTTFDRKKSACYEMLQRASKEGSCDCSNEPYGFVKGKESFD
jgi:hypothetical protein